MTGILRMSAGRQTSARFAASYAHEPLANAIYRAAFQSLDMPLEDGSGLVENSESARLDQGLGIDVVLRTLAGPVATLQEKFLFVERGKLPGGEPTVTVEYMNDPGAGARGDWFSLACQYLFVGYDYGYTAERAPGFSDWMLIDWPALVRARLPWRTLQNGRDGAKASFQYVPFSAVPAACVVRSKMQYAGYRAAGAARVWSVER